MFPDNVDVSQGEVFGYIGKNSDINKIKFSQLLNFPAVKRDAREQSSPVGQQFSRCLDSSKKDITRISTTTFLKDMFWMLAIISLIE